MGNAVDERIARKLARQTIGFLATPAGAKSTAEELVASFGISEAATAETMAAARALIPAMIAKVKTAESIRKTLTARKVFGPEVKTFAAARVGAAPKSEQAALVRMAEVTHSLARAWRKAGDNKQAEVYSNLRNGFAKSAGLPAFWDTPRA